MGLQTYHEKIDALHVDAPSKKAILELIDLKIETDMHDLIQEIKLLELKINEQKITLVNLKWYLVTTISIVGTLIALIVLLKK